MAKKKRGLFLTTWTVFEAIQSLGLLALILYVFRAEIFSMVGFMLLFYIFLTLAGVYFVFKWDRRAYYVALTLLGINGLLLVLAIGGLISQNASQVMINSLLELLWVYAIHKKLDLFK